MLGEFIAEVIGEVLGELLIAGGAAAYDAVRGAGSDATPDPTPLPSGPARWVDYDVRAALQRLGEREREAFVDALVFTMRYDGHESPAEWTRLEQAVTAMGANGAGAVQILWDAGNRVGRVAGPQAEEALIARVAGALPTLNARTALLHVVTAVATAEPNASPRQREVIGRFAHALGVAAPTPEERHAATTTCSA